MAEDILIGNLDRTDYLKNPLEIGLDDEWKKKSMNFDDRMKTGYLYPSCLCASANYLCWQDKERNDGLSYSPLSSCHQVCLTKQSRALPEYAL